MRAAPVPIRARTSERCARRTGSHTAARLWVQMDLKLLEQTLEQRGEPRFRARQIWDWVARGAGSYAEMTNVPAELRDALEGVVPLSSLSVEREARSTDGTEKALFHT